MTLHRTLATSAALTLAVAGLAACGGGDEPAQSSSSASPTVVESDDTTTSGGTADPSSPSDSSGAATTLPEAAKAKSQDGAVAFTQFYFEQSGEALKTGDTSFIESMGVDCVPCLNYAKNLNSDFKKGWKFDRNPNRVSITGVQPRDDGGFRIEVEIDADEYRALDSSGDVKAEAEAVKYTVVTNTGWRAGRWNLNDYARTE